MKKALGYYLLSSGLFSLSSLIGALHGTSQAATAIASSASKTVGVASTYVSSCWLSKRME